MKQLLFAFLIGLVTMGLASGDVIDFETLTGPTTFAAAGNSTTLTISTAIGNVIISGGVILTDATNLPADETSVYGTAGNTAGSGVTVGTGFTNPLTITFPQPINNFFLDVLNGNTETVDYQVADNMGNSATFSLPENLVSGEKTIGFAATGTTVTISAITGQTQPNGIFWDFFVDNLHFDEQLPAGLNPISTTTGPSSSVPEPSTFLFSSLALAAVVGFRKRQRS